MTGVIGLIVVFVMVIGGYLWGGGKFSIILGSIHYEMMIIGGSAVGAFIIANGTHTLKTTLGDIGAVFRGPRWKGDDYAELLILLYELLRVARQSPVQLEEHIEAPETSDIFSRFPRILADEEAISLICDTLRAATMNYDDPHQVEEVIDKRIETMHHHALQSSHALQNMADGLPALGIVAAVLGVIKTMGSIDQPPEVLGKMIGGALVGTFLGVFLAYAIVGPFATKVKHVREEDHHFYILIREVLVASLHNHAPNMCVEIGRQNTPSGIRPSFDELDGALRSDNAQAAA
ncbi:flagellar motor stator protein MotA [Pontivivens ytuae]|uniref:Flagellar motor stator protein MotA n=1 Tax=Pontivivens ytuae TaxID=2789856 RepID=A0A7S9LQ53_9RHOB|nr:flagellar motor stator protein MotA [Pontivivens ytuae]QPH53188.1 flagellar motor stator protein MotA [Pontivivens ytuae]